MKEIRSLKTFILNTKLQRPRFEFMIPGGDQTYVPVIGNHNMHDFRKNKTSYQISPDA